MTKKQFLRTVAFALVFCAVLVLLCDAFEQDEYPFPEKFYTYRNFEEGTVDAVYIGTSGVDRYFNAAKAYEEYGMVVYPLTSDAMPVWLYPLVLEEVLNRQTPELIIIDPRPFAQDHDTKSVEVGAQRVLGAMPFFSLTRLKMVLKTMEINHLVDETQPRYEISFLLPFVKFHTEWEMENYSLVDSLRRNEHPYGSFYMNSVQSVRALERVEKPLDESYAEALNPISEQAMYELLDMLREIDIPVLFLDTPQVTNNTEDGKLYTALCILEEEGFDCLSYNLPGVAKEMGLDLDYSKDFYNGGHVNFYGSEKTTASIAAYLDANYDLPDRRNDPAVQAYWDGIYDRILATIDYYEELAASQTAD